MRTPQHGDAIRDRRKHGQSQTAEIEFSVSAAQKTIDCDVHGWLGCHIGLNWVANFYAISSFNFLSKIERLLLLILIFIFLRAFSKSSYISSTSYPISSSIAIREGCHAFIMICSLYIAHRVVQRLLLCRLVAAASIRII